MYYSSISLPLRRYRFDTMRDQRVKPFPCKFSDLEQFLTYFYHFEANASEKLFYQEPLNLIFLFKKNGLDMEIAYFSY